MKLGEMNREQVARFHRIHCSKHFCDNECPLLSADDLHCYYDDLMEGEPIPEGRYNMRRDISKRIDDKRKYTSIKKGEL